MVYIQLTANIQPDYNYSEDERSMAKARDTYKYHLIKDKRVVHRGITEDLARREKEHQREFPHSRVKQIGRKTTHEAALKWERRGGKRIG